MSAIGYIIVDRKTKDIDWDSEMHPSVEEAIESLTGGRSMYCKSPDQETEDKTHWAKHYKICAVIDRSNA